MGRRLPDAGMKSEWLLLNEKRTVVLANPNGQYANLVFVGQYCEVPDNVVYTVEYSVHSAALAVASLLGVPQMVPPPAYRGLDHPNALAGAMRRILE